MPAISLKKAKLPSEDIGTSDGKYYDGVQLNASHLASETDEPKVICSQPTEDTLTVSIPSGSPDTCKDYMKQGAACCFGISCIVIWIGAEILANIPINLLC